MTWLLDLSPASRVTCWIQMTLPSRYSSLEACLALPPRCEPIPAPGPASWRAPGTRRSPRPGAGTASRGSDGGFCWFVCDVQQLLFVTAADHRPAPRAPGKPHMRSWASAPSPSLGRRMLSKQCPLCMLPSTRYNLQINTRRRFFFFNKCI